MERSYEMSVSTEPRRLVTAKLDARLVKRKRESNSTVHGGHRRHDNDTRAQHQLQSNGTPMKVTTRAERLRDLDLHCTFNCMDEMS